MSRTLRVAACQLAAHDRAAFARAWPAIRERIREAGRSGARVIVLPEGTLPAYVLGGAPFASSEIAAALDDCAFLARELQAVIVTGAARNEEGRTFNSAVVIDADGRAAGYADKHFLWHFDRQWFAPGERIEPVRTAAGVLGVLVCADGRIPLIARALVDRGAEMLVMPTAWVTSGRDPEQLENIQADLLARVRARENGVPFIAANKCGVERGCVAYCGKSQIVAADGSISAAASEQREEVIASTVTIGRAAPLRLAIDASGDRYGGGSQPLRVAISARSQESLDSLDERLRIVEADLLVNPDGMTRVTEPAALPLVIADDAMMVDPGGLAAHRLRGAQCAVWTTTMRDPWRTAFARARAVELRMYVLVIEPAVRAFAVDPDGAAVCGTFAAYEIASFTFDPAKTRQTLVAPGTDVIRGLERARTHAP